MRTIGDSAFSGCAGLKSVSIPDGVTFIGSFAFSGCTALTSITIPESVRRIDSFAFRDCTGLTSVIFSGCVKEIKDNVFEGCSNLTSIIRRIEKIDIEKMPSGRALATLLEGKNWVDKYGVVFSEDKTKLLKAPYGLKEYIIPNGTIVICEGAFSDCYETLRSIVIPDSVQEIESNAFSKEWYKKYKMMECLVVPSSVKKLGSTAFEGIKKVSYYGDAKESGTRMWGAEMLMDGKPSHVGELPWGPYDPHNGYTSYYKGEIKNGVPNGYGGVYEIDMSGWGNDKLLYSGRWEDGVFLNGKNPIDELTDEEWRHIN